MFRNLSRVAIIAAASAVGCPAFATPTAAVGPPAAAPDPTYRGALLHAAPLTAAAGSAGAAPGVEPPPQWLADALAPSASAQRPESDGTDVSDHRGEYEGLLTDAILRLIRDLRPQLAGR